MAAPTGLPEHFGYQDTGCDWHPSCLNCPLVRCRYDEPEPIPVNTLKAEKQAEIRELRSQGYTLDRIALMIGVSKRTVYRYQVEEQSA